MTVSQFFGVMQARWRLAAAVLLLCLLVSVALSLFLPKQYTATASVVVDVKSTDPIVGSTSPAMMAPSYMATQVDIMESERVAQQVVRMLKLAGSAEMRRDWQDDTGASGDFEVWLASRLRRKLDIKPARESNLIELRFTSVDARFAATVANAFVQAYLDTTLGLRTDPAKRYSTFFDERAKQLRDDLERAQSRLSAAQKSKGVMATDDRMDVESARLNEISSQLVSLQTTSADSRSREVAGATAPDTLVDVINNPVVAGLRTELMKQEVKVQELSERVGERHPQLVELRTSVATLRVKLEQETRRLSDSLTIGNIINESRESQVRAALEKQRERVMQMKGERSELAVLQRDAELAQRAYDGVLARLSQVSMESLSTQTNAALLMAATEPSKASFPKLPLNLFLGLFAGLLLAIVAVLAREARDRRIRSVEDVLRDMQLPVLGTLLGSRPGNPPPSWTLPTPHSRGRRWWPFAWRLRWPRSARAKPGALPRAP